MPGGARSMKGGRQMIYKSIIFKADPFHMIWNLTIE